VGWRERGPGGEGFFVFLLATCFLLCACRERQSPRPSSSPQAPRRIIALTPSVEETLFALGLGGRVVGVGDYCRWPPETRSLPQLGGLFNPNLERIVSLKPDLAVLIPSERDLGAKIGRLGIPSLIVKNESLADVEASFLAIARRCGVPAEGERLAAQWRKDLAPRPLAWKPKVMLSVGRPSGRLTDVLAAGPGTFFDDLLVRLGGVNAFADAPAHYPQVSLEEVVARAPDVILELRADPVPPDIAAGLVRDWQQLPNVPAVRNGRVVVLAGDYVVIPGPRLPRLYQEMRTVLEAAEPKRGQVSAAPNRRVPHPLAPSPTLSHRPGEGESLDFARVAAPLSRLAGGGGRGDGGEGRSQ
jgi:iron complex transport system substrate-binding protein